MSEGSQVAQAPLALDNFSHDRVAAAGDRAIVRSQRLNSLLHRTAATVEWIVAERLLSFETVHSRMVRHWRTWLVEQGMRCKMVEVGGERFGQECKWVNYTMSVHCKSKQKDSYFI